MLVNPKNNHLYTNDGVLIKKLHCPLNKQWLELEQNASLQYRSCNTCNRNVLDTAFFHDQQILAIVREDPSICLYLTANQQNIEVDLNLP